MSDETTPTRTRLAAVLRRLSTLTTAAIILMAASACLLAYGATHPDASTHSASSSAIPAGDVTSLLRDVHSGQVASVGLNQDTGRFHISYRDGRPAADVAVPVVVQRDILLAVTSTGIPLSSTPVSRVSPGTASVAEAANADVDPSTSRATAGSAVPAAPTAHEAVHATAHAPTSAVNGSGGSGSSVASVLGIIGVMVGGILLILGIRRRARKDSEDDPAPDGAPTLTTGPGSPSRSNRNGERATTWTVAPAAVPTTRFTDVAGCDEAISELREMAQFLTEPERFTRTGAKPLKGALLAGPPGTGKTLLARAVAGEAGVPFYSVAGSDFVEMYVGVGAKRIRDLFAAARKHERAIVFIDEIDAVARRRSSGSDSAAHAEGENTLIAMLAQMDGFDSSNVVVIAATNRADILDPAVTRPGRLDRKIEVPNPDRRGREQILRVHAEGKPLTSDVDLTAIARRTPGFSGAQLSALVNEACLEAARRDLHVVDQDCFAHAVATIAMGRARTSALVTEHDREITAWHEAGHTVAAYLQPDADDPVQVTIIPRGPAGGVTWMSGNDDSFLPRRKAHAQLVTALAGRAAEEILLGGEFTQGASGDLQSATSLALRMATQYGMTELGLQVRDPNSPTPAVTEVVEQMLVHAHAAARQLLTAHEPLLRAVACELLEEETLTLAQVALLAVATGTPAVPCLPAPPPLPARPGTAGSPTVVTLSPVSPSISEDTGTDRTSAGPRAAAARGSRARRQHLVAVIEPVTRAAHAVSRRSRRADRTRDDRATMPAA